MNVELDSALDERSTATAPTVAPQPETKLSDRAIKSSAWLFGIRATVHACLMLQVVVLVKFLSPEQFGIVGIALLCLSMLKTFTEGGMDLALIQRQDDIQMYLPTAWTVQVIRGVFIASMLFLLAPYCCQFFNQPEATQFIQAFGIPVLIAGFMSIGIVEFKKQVQYQKLVAFEVVPAILSFVITILIAYQFHTIWAILIGRIAESVAKVVISFQIHPFRPRLEINRAHFRDLFGFGKWIYMSSILLFLLNQGDNIVVGRILGASWLGFYQFAFRIAKLPVTEVNSTLGQVLFPAFSRLQNDVPRLKSAYFRSLTIILTLTIPFALGIFVIAPYAIPVFLGDEWAPAVQLVQIFSLLGLLVSVGSTTGNIFKAVGRPSYTTLSQFCRAVIMFTAMLPLMQWRGAVGAAYAVVLSELAVGGFLLMAVASLLHASLRDFLRCCACQLAAALLMVLGVHFTGQQLGQPYTITDFLALMFAGAAIYAPLLALLDLLFHLGLIRMLREIFLRWRK